MSWLPLDLALVHVEGPVPERERSRLLLRAPVEPGGGTRRARRGGVVASPACGEERCQRDACRSDPGRAQEPPAGERMLSERREHLRVQWIVRSGHRPPPTWTLPCNVVRSSTVCIAPSRHGDASFIP